MIIFCDFDGTITNHDTLDYIIQSYYGDLKYKTIEQKMINEKGSHNKQLREILIDMNYTIDEIFNLLGDNIINNTFYDFYHTALLNNFDFYIISSGCKQIIKHYLPYIPDEKIYANDYNCILTQPNYKLLDKLSIVKKLSVDKKCIYIGDGISDFDVINDVNYLYVKGNSHLEQKCKDDKIRHISFNNFNEIDCTKHLKLLSPGVVRVSDDILNSSKQQHTFMHRHKQFHNLYNNVSVSLRKMVCDNISNYTTLLVTGSGTTSMDEVINAYSNKNMLILSNGMFGERWLEIASFYDKTVSYIKKEWGCVFDMSEIEATIIEKNIKTVLLVHCDTSVGILNNIHDIGILVKQKNITFIVDAVSTFGAIPINMCKSNIDYVITNPNKALGSIMGIGIIIGRNSMLDKLDISNYSYSLNLKRHYKFALRNETCNTCSISSINALSTALNNYSCNNYKELFDLLYYGIKYPKLLNYDISSPCIITILCNSEKIIQYLFDNGYVVYECKGHLLNKGFQISLYGFNGNEKNIVNIVKLINGFT
jgi:aspartate aminotransferase-like enzyme/2-hydroxy-3-keto-5-methylthiopentenyl-1-phosphate phosphatase